MRTRWLSGARASRATAAGAQGSRAEAGAEARATSVRTRALATSGAGGGGRAKRADSAPRRELHERGRVEVRRAAAALIARAERESPKGAPGPAASEAVDQRARAGRGAGFEWTQDVGRRRGRDGPARLSEPVGWRGVAPPRLACHACACWSPAAPGSSAPTSSGGCSRRATRSSCSTSSPTRRQPRRTSTGVDARAASRATSPRPATSRRPRAGCDAIVNFAAETHVDRSILGATDFGRTEFFGDAGAARAGARERRRASCRSRPTRSTATSSRAALARGDDPLQPSSPYSVAKAGGDLHIPAYVRTFGVNASITRGSNTYGPNQYPEKLIPLFVTNALEGKPLPLYGDGRQIRDWLYVEDHCAGIELVLREGAPGEAYNVGGGEERENIDVANAILALLGADPSLLKHVEDRPGHDRRYALDTLEAARRSAGRRRSASSEGLADDGRLVPRQPRLVGADQVGRVPRRTTSASTPPASPAERVRERARCYREISASRGTVAAAGRRCFGVLGWRRCYACRGAPACPLRRVAGRGRARGRRRTAISTTPAAPRARRDDDHGPAVAADRRASSTAPVTIVVSGHGWGHGVGHGAVGRARLRAARLELRRRSSPTTTPARRSSSGRARRCASCCSRAVSARDARLRGALVGDRREGREDRARAGELDLERRLDGRRQEARPPLTFVARQGAAVRSAASRIAAALVVSVGRRPGSRSSTCSKLEPYLKGVVGLEMPSTVAGRGARGAGGRRAHLRARAPGRGRHGERLRHLRRHAQPGLRRHRGRDARGHARRGRHRPPRAPLPRARSITAYYSSSSGGRTVSAAEAYRHAGPVPRLGRRPLRHGLAEPRLGADALRRAQVAKALKRAAAACSTCARPSGRRATSPR